MSGGAQQNERVCQVCKTPVPASPGFCPVCALGSALEPEAPSGALNSATTQSQIRFDHFELELFNGEPIELGRGAMGVTYRAIDINLGSPVALKVVNARYLGEEQMQHRFVAEARAAAALRHPNVASVFHLGKSGEDYFYVMELVEGEPLDRVLRFRGPLEVGLALEIAEQAAAGLSAAYRRGVVHRDIKPANLMAVFGEEGKVTVKVIDFGLAKTLRLPGLESNDYDPGVFYGTPHFASPEQCAGKETDIRSDLYSLGVTLWSLLTGRVPFEGSLHDVVQQQQFARPPFEQLEHIPQPVVGLLGRLMEKDPARRPQTPLELQRLIRALRSGLPDTMGKLYRGVRRWGAVAAVLLVLIAGVGIWLFQRQQHSNEQLQALEAKFDQLEAGVDSFAEVQDKVRREKPGDRPEQLEQKTYEELAKRLGLDAATLKKELPRFAKELKEAPSATAFERANAAFVEKDYNEAERLALVAADEAEGTNPKKTTDAINAFLLAGSAAEKRVEYADALKRLREAEKLTDRSRGPLEWAKIQSAIASVLDLQGHFLEEVPILREVVKERDKALGSEHPDTLLSRDDLAQALDRGGKYPEAETEFRSVIASRERVFGANSSETLETRARLARTFMDAGRFAEAESELLAVRGPLEKALGAEHPDVIQVRDNLAFVLFREGKNEEADVEMQAVIKLREKVLGLSDPSTIRSRYRMANILEAEGKYGEAETESRSTLELSEKALGPEHPTTLLVRNSLANQLGRRAKYPEAETEYRELVTLQQKVLGPEHPNTLSAGSNLAAILQEEGKYVDADNEFLSVIPLETKVLGQEHPLTIFSNRELAHSFLQQHRYQEAESRFLALLPLAVKTFGSESAETLAIRFFLSSSLDGEGRYPEAENECRAVLATAVKALGPKHAYTTAAQDELGVILAHRGKYSEAEKECREALHTEETLAGAEPSDTLNTQADLACILRDEGKLSEADTGFRAALSLREKVLGAQHPDTLGTCFELALCLRAEGKTAEAKALAERATNGAITVFGPESPTAKQYDQLLSALR
jgi:tetratricopeptide (TPR) repeat protein